MHTPSLFLRCASWATIRARRGALIHARRQSRQSVLVLGVYLADRENSITHLVQTLGEARDFNVDQKWISLLGSPPSKAVARVTVRRNFARMAKFTLMNYLLATTAWRLYNFVLICDDDILLPRGFLDQFLALQERYDFALAQPARTHNSYIDHPITEQVNGLVARETRFTEIGPVTCIRADMMRLIAPFDEDAPMGWGLDFVWPHVAHRHGLRVGIVDATPVDHSLRAPVSSYDGGTTRERMKAYLAARPHYETEEAFVVLNAYADSPTGSADG